MAQEFQRTPLGNRNAHFFPCLPSWPTWKVFQKFKTLFSRSSAGEGGKTFLAADFLKHCSSKYVGCVYKISVATINGYCQEANTDYYIGLADYHLHEAFGQSQVHRERNFNILRAFYFAFHNFCKWFNLCRSF